MFQWPCFVRQIIFPWLHAWGDYWAIQLKTWIPIGSNCFPLIDSFVRGWKIKTPTLKSKSWLFSNKTPRKHDVFFKQRNFIKTLKLTTSNHHPPHKNQPTVGTSQISWPLFGKGCRIGSKTSKTRELRGAFSGGQQMIIEKNRAEIFRRFFFDVFFSQSGCKNSKLNPISTGEFFRLRIWWNPNGFMIESWWHLMMGSQFDFYLSSWGFFRVPISKLLSWRHVLEAFFQTFLQGFLQITQRVLKKTARNCYHPAN